MSEVKYVTTVNAWEMVQGSNDGVILEFVEEIIGSMASYDFELSLFKLIGDNMIAAAEDPQTSADVNLDHDQVIKDLVERFAKALHG